MLVKSRHQIHDWTASLICDAVLDPDRPAQNTHFIVLAIIRLSLMTCRNVRCTAYDSSQSISQSRRSGLIKPTHFVNMG
jgi:hypothetical protein